MRGIPYALLTLGAICGFVVAWALNEFWTYTIGYLFARIAHVGIPIPFHKAIHPFGFLGTINDTVHRRLSEVAGAAERAMIALFLQTIRSFLGLAHEIAALAETVEKQFLSIVAGVLPSAIRNAVKSIWNLLKQLPVLAKKVRHLVGYLTRVISHAVKVALGDVWKELVKFGKFTAYGFAHALKSIAGIYKRLKHLEQWLFSKHGLKLARYLLKALALEWVLAVNILKLGEAVVSWSHHVITAIIRFLGRIEEPLSLEELTRAAQDSLREVDHVMRWYLNEYHVSREAPGASDVGTPT